MHYEFRKRHCTMMYCSLPFARLHKQLCCTEYGALGEDSICGKRYEI